MSSYQEKATQFTKSTVVLGVGIIGILLVIWLWIAPGLSAMGGMFKPMTFESPIGNPAFNFDKAVDVTTAQPGDTVNYTLTYANINQDSQAFNVRLYDFLPAGVEYISASQPPTFLPDRVLMFYAPTLGPDTDPVEVSVQVRVLPGHELLQNYAMVTADGVTPTHDSAVVMTVPGTDKLSLTQQGKVAVLVERELVYTVRCINNSSVPFNNLWIEDILPSGMTLTSTSTAPATTALPVLNWSLETINPGFSWDLVITGSAPSTAGVITNTAALYAPSHVPLHALFATQVVTEGAILNLEKTASSDTVYPNGTLVYTLRATNEGSITATQVVLTDTFPAAVTPVSAHPNPLNTSGGRWVWYLGSVGIEQEKTVVVTTTVNSDAVGVLHNVAEVDSPNAWPGYDDVLTYVEMLKIYLPLLMKANPSM